MAFTRITEEELALRGATTLPDAPTIPANQLKQEFDAPAKEVVAPAVNHLMEELEDYPAAASIGAEAPEGRTGRNIQAVLEDISKSSCSQIYRNGVTGAAGAEIRIPASYEENDDRITTNSLVIPFSDYKSNGTPYSFKSLEVNNGYVNITLAEAVSNVTIGVAIFN